MLVGNSISVNVLERTLPGMLKLAKLSVDPVFQADPKDVWRLAVEACFRLTKASNDKARRVEPAEDGRLPVRETVCLEDRKRREAAVYFPEVLKNIRRTC